MSQPAVRRALTLSTLSRGRGGFYGGGRGGNRIHGEGEEGDDQGEGGDQSDGGRGRRFRPRYVRRGRGGGPVRDVLIHYYLLTNLHVTLGPKTFKM